MKYITCVWAIIICSCFFGWGKTRWKIEIYLNNIILFGDLCLAAISNDNWVGVFWILSTLLHTWRRFSWSSRFWRLRRLLGCYCPGCPHYHCQLRFQKVRIVRSPINQGTLWNLACYCLDLTWGCWVSVLFCFWGKWLFLYWRYYSIKTLHPSHIHCCQTWLGMNHIYVLLGWL